MTHTRTTTHPGRTAMSIYIDNGYESRTDYLKSLAEEHDVPLRIVLSTADLLGPNEDFDGLVIALEDYQP